MVRTSWRMHDVHLFIILLSLLWQWDLGGMVITKGSTWCAHRKIGITAPNGTNLGEAKLHLTPKVYHSKFWKPNNSIVISIGNEAAVTEYFFCSLICSFFLSFFFFSFYHPLSFLQSQPWTNLCGTVKKYWLFLSYCGSSPFPTHPPPPLPLPPATVGKNVPDYSS